MALMDVEGYEWSTNGVRLDFGDWTLNIYDILCRYQCQYNQCQYHDNVIFLSYAFTRII